jgi:hypothetical protein
MAELKLDLPSDLLKVLEGLGDPQRAIKECVVLELYRRGEISSGKEKLEAELRDLDGGRQRGCADGSSAYLALPCRRPCFARQSPLAPLHFSDNWRSPDI